MRRFAFDSISARLLRTGDALLTSYLLARDHLEQARTILSVDDPSSQQLRQTLQVMINLIDELQTRFPRRASNVIAFPGNDLRMPRE
jgi:hypothetical protein